MIHFTDWNRSARLTNGCPVCDSRRVFVQHTVAGTFNDMSGIGRVRKCSDCGHKWRTIELTEQELQK